MPMYNGNYTAPVWINNMPPSIGETELLAMSRTIEASQVLTGNGAPTRFTSGKVAQRYADTSTNPYTVYKLISAATENNVWVLDDSNGNIAMEYDSTQDYAEGDYCLHNGILYRANTNITAEAWNASHWTQARVADDLAAHEADHNNPHNVTAAQTGAVGGGIIAPTESSTTASQSYTVGDYFFLGGLLYRATSPIPEGETIVVGTNAESAAMADDVADQKVRVGTVNLSTAWTGAGSPYTQTVLVHGASVTESCKVDLQPTELQLAQLVYDGVSSIVIENNAGVLTAYAIGNAPTQAMTVQCTVTETVAGRRSGGGIIIEKTFTESGTYNAEDDNADGYNPVIVDVVAQQPVYLLDNTHFPAGSYDSSSAWCAKLYANNTTFSKTSNSYGQCIYHNSSSNKTFQFLEPIPATATKMYITVYASGRTGQWNLWTLIWVDAIGLTGQYYGNWTGQTKKSVMFTAYNSTAEAINSQTGVVIHVDTPYTVPYQTVEVDISDLDVTTYLTGHSCDCDAWLYRIWFE